AQVNGERVAEQRHRDAGEGDELECGDEADRDGGAAPGSDEIVRVLHRRKRFRAGCVRSCNCSRGTLRHGPTRRAAKGWVRPCLSGPGSSGPVLAMALRDGMYVADV